MRTKRISWLGLFISLHHINYNIYVIFFSWNCVCLKKIYRNLFIYSKVKVYMYIKMVVLHSVRISICCLLWTIVAGINSFLMKCKIKVTFNLGHWSHEVKVKNGIISMTGFRKKSFLGPRHIHYQLSSQSTGDFLSTTPITRKLNRAFV